MSEEHDSEKLDYKYSIVKLVERLLIQWIRKTVTQKTPHGRKLKIGTINHYKVTQIGVGIIPQLGFSNFL